MDKQERQDQSEIKMARNFFTERERFQITFDELAENFGNGGLLYDHAAWCFTMTNDRVEREMYRQLRRQNLYIFNSGLGY